MSARNDTELKASVLKILQAPLAECWSFEEFRVRLSQYINELINHRFEYLVSLLYRIDINESKLRQVLEENVDGDSGAVIADLIIAREAEKIKSRREYGRRDNAIDDDEKW